MSTHDRKDWTRVRRLYVKILYRCFICTGQEILVVLVETHAVYSVTEAGILPENEPVIKLKKLYPA